MASKIKSGLVTASRVTATLAIVAIAGVAAWFAWQHYIYAPWTRDGRVQANVINIAPNVAGTVADVAVDDDSYVHKGDLLFRIDPTRFKHAVSRRQAQLSKAKAQAVYDRKNAARLANLPKGAVSKQKIQLARSKARTAEASIKTVKAQLAQAKQNLEWATVRSPVDGYVTHLQLNGGDYVQQGGKSITLVQADSFHVTAYFEETKLANIQIGDSARVTLMSRDEALPAHVANIAYGIAVANNAQGERNLPNVQPKFQWVRLAQRVPVKIKFDHPDKVGRLSIGMTATVRVKSGDDSNQNDNETAGGGPTSHDASVSS
ncbi:HlyD family secretion protein [Salinisphaera sp. USBA-960]|uniref:efflux RND transporter periplasmic adaptor subunit n=1 Tax=Salinisphaera orenii TaxID=856731 RepID=UPI000DBEAB05|nr:HlyD family secretion protein [Salifodinibacter halophilus]NNC26731.1 HlyD family secretion protein [Salifodinibacter halophilus]